MEKKENALEEIVKRRGIFQQSFGLYEGSAGFYDYGPIGLRIKRKIEALWRKGIVERLNAMEIQTPDVLPEIVLKASGHVATFADPVATCETCGTAHRLDKLLEQYHEKKGDADSAALVKKMGMEELMKKVQEHGIRCERCGGKLSHAEKFNLMFKTHIAQGTKEPAYLRPETAQGIFIAFKDMHRAYGLSLPCAICQVGKAYRNEISPRQGLVRMREFTQMELELFFDPEHESEEIGGFGKESVLKRSIRFVRAGHEKETEMQLKELVEKKLVPNEYFAILLGLEDQLLEGLGFAKDAYRFRQLEKEELPHYSKGNVDLEIRTGYGYIEVAGNAARGDYDLSSHAKMSGNDTSVVSNNRKVVPHVVEASIGLDRLLLSLLDNSVKDDERGWKWLNLGASVAPYSYAIFPLQKDEKLVAKAKEVYCAFVGKGIECYYSESGSIGKRYAKADEIGVPNAVTIDYTTLEDDTVTIRHRDTAKQTRKEWGKIG